MGREKKDRYTSKDVVLREIYSKCYFLLKSSRLWVRTPTVLHIEESSLNDEIFEHHFGYV